ncbi:hypothetical protein PC120_g5494 [Phytophthora cactorum]|nr:hypothetical protein PC120_g5494 [Phytophthora cactorum]
MEHPVFANCPPAQQDALNKLISLLGPEGVSHLASQGPEAVKARLESFSRYENTEAAPGEREDLQRAGWRESPSLDREVEMAMGSALLQTEKQRVALAMSNLGGRAREWALTCGTSVDAGFPSWAQLKRQLSRVFALPNQVYRARSRLLAIRQGKQDLLDYGLRTSADRTEVFRVHPSSFEEAVSVALNAEHNFRSARPGWYAGSAGSSSGPGPMDLSYAEDEEAELLPAEQRTSIRRCFTCGSTRHLRATVRNQRKAPPS